jgi:uncharacterized membrane protein YidH (DUF202 family)
VALPEDHPPWDDGLQNERTGLAWQRTMLSGLACGLIVTRLLAGVSLTLAVLTGVLALGAAAAFGLNAQALAEGRHLDDARAAALATALLVVTALAAIGYVLLL